MTCLSGVLESTYPSGLGLNTPDSVFQPGRVETVGGTQSPRHELTEMNTFAFPQSFTSGFSALLGNAYRECISRLFDISVLDLTSSQNALYVLYVF